MPPKLSKAEREQLKREEAERKAREEEERRAREEEEEREREEKERIEREEAARRQKMATVKKARARVWVKFPEDARAFSITPPDDDDIVDTLIEYALHKSGRTDINGGSVTASFDGRTLNSDETCPSTTTATPVLLVINEGPRAKRKKTEAESAQLPRNSKSISRQVSDNSFNKHLDQKVPPYCHWLAVGLYNVYVKAKQSLEANPGTNHQFEFKLGGEVFTLTEKHIRFGVESVKAACSLSAAPNSSVRGITSSESMSRAEQAFSCLYARALDRFLFEDATVAACLHQAPNRVREGDCTTTLEKVDVYALPFCANFYPDGPILVADLTNGSFGAADKESLLYAVNGVSGQCGSTWWPLQLGIPGTRSVAELQVYFPVHKGMWRLPIAHCSPYDPAFLCTLYVATNYLCRSVATTHLDGPPECPIPQEGMVH